MKWSDIDLAITFLDVRDQIVLECPTSNDIPYVKRYLNQMLGEPIRMLGNMWYYLSNDGVTKRIIIVSILAEQHTEWHEDDLFHVGWDNDRDEQFLVDHGFEIVRG